MPAFTNDSQKYVMYGLPLETSAGNDSTRSRESFVFSLSAATLTLPEIFCLGMLTTNKWAVP